MEDSDQSADPLDVMSQFMDVITTFKCKVCEFICYKQEDLVEHVKSAHLPQPTPPSCEPAPTVVCYTLCSYS